MIIMQLKNQVFKLFIDLRFAISLLVLIALIISSGSIIEQDESPTFYIENYPKDNKLFGILSYNSILLLGLDHVYNSWIFLTLLFLLGCSLMVCTISQQLPNLFLAKKLSFLKLTTHKLKLPCFFSLDFDPEKLSFFKSLHFLFVCNFYLHQQKRIIYACKGLLGKGGPIVVHFSLICIFLGAFIGALGGFTAQEFLPKGEIIRIQNILSSGFFTHLPDISIRLNDFWIDYNQQKVNQFYSNLSVVSNNGIEQLNQTISVNYPAAYHNIVFYQTDWNILGIRLQKGNRFFFEYPTNLVSKNPKVWVSSIIDNNGDMFLIILDNLRYTFKLYDKGGNFLKQVSFGDSLSLSQNINVVGDLVLETGLQIKYDPSLPIIFFGFLILMGSTFISYITFSEFWVSAISNKLFLGGQTTRSKTNFEILCSKLLTYLSSD